MHMEPWSLSTVWWAPKAINIPGSWGVFDCKRKRKLQESCCRRTCSTITLPPPPNSFQAPHELRVVEGSFGPRLGVVNGPHAIFQHLATILARPLSVLVAAPVTPWATSV